MMLRITIFVCICLYASFGVRADFFSEELVKIKEEIQIYSDKKDERTREYELERDAFQVKFQSERDGELADCERRKLLCNNSHAKRKYEPIFEELEKVYFADIFTLSEKIRKLNTEILEIEQEKLDREQEILNNRTPEEVKRDLEKDILLEKAEEDFVKAKGYFENNSFNNAKIFYEKSCVTGPRKVYTCYYELAQTERELKNFLKALEYYEHALAKTQIEVEQETAKKGINEMKKLLGTFVKLDDLLKGFHENIDAQFFERELILKQSFYDELITKLRNRKKGDEVDERLKILIEYVVDSMLSARKKVTQEINDIYN